MKLQPGDHVAQKDLTEEQYHAIAKKFIGSGAIDGEYPSYGNNRTLPFFGWHPQGNDLFHGQNVFSGRLLTPSQILEDDNGWFERKENPPVNSICEASFCGKWVQVEILKYAGPMNAAACLLSEKIDGRNLYWSSNFRPIKSDRDKAIEFALSQDCDPQEGMLSRRDFCGKLFDAGALKLPEGESNEKL